LRDEEERDKYEDLRNKYKESWMNFSDVVLNMNIEAKLKKNVGKGIKN
jgi:hypothetical protein